MEVLSLCQAYTIYAGRCGRGWRLREDSLLPELFKTQLNSSRVDTYTVTFELSGSMFKSYRST